jgi:peptidoglycan hydrolase CwlO-like protein
MSRVVLVSILVSAAVVLVSGVLAAGGYAYHHQTTHVSALKAERAHLNAQLSSAQAKLLRTQLSLGKRVRSLSKAKRNLTKMSKDLAAAKKRADESYASGYSSGASSGYNDGLYAGSDSLSCSDDPDVTWLPACNWGE